METKNDKQESGGDNRDQCIYRLRGKKKKVELVSTCTQERQQERLFYRISRGRHQEAKGERENKDHLENWTSVERERNKAGWKSWIVANVNRRRTCPFAQKCSVMIANNSMLCFVNSI